MLHQTVCRITHDERRRTRRRNKSASLKLQRRVIARKSLERPAAAPHHLLPQTKFCKPPCTFLLCSGLRLPSSSPLCCPSLSCSYSASADSTTSAPTSCSGSNTRNCAFQLRCNAPAAPPLSRLCRLFPAIKSTLCQIKSANQRAKLKLAVTVTAVFISFVLRATYAVMLALSACAPPHPCAQSFTISPIIVTTTCTTTTIIIHQRCRSVWSTEARCNNDPCHRCFSDLKLVCARSSYS